MTGDSSGTVDSTDQKTFSIQLQEKLVIDRLSDVYLSSITTQNTKLNTSSDTANFILKINEFNVHTSTNQSELVSKILIPNNAKTWSEVVTHKSKKLNYVCSVNPSTITSLSGSITTNSGETILEEVGEFVERENNQIFSVLAGPGYGDSTSWFDPWKHVLKYSVEAFTALALGAAYPSYPGEADTAYVHALQLNHKIEYVRVNGGTSGTSQKHLGEVDENGVRAAVDGETVYHVHHLDAGTTHWDDAVHVRDHADSHKAVTDFNVAEGIIHTYDGDEYIPFGTIKTGGIDTSSDSDSVYIELEDDANQLTRGHMKIGSQNGGRTAMATPGTSIWLQDSPAPTTFRCIIELVIIPRKDKDK